MRMGRPQIGTLGAAAALAVLLVACGQSPSSPRATHEPAPQSDAAATQDQNPDADMVTAVGPAGAASLMGVKFRLGARPVVGTPVKIVVALIPAPDAQINHIHGAFAAGAGLQLASDRSFDATEVHGATLYRELTVVPQQTGVLSLSVTILIDQDSGSKASTYSIPLIATDSSS